MLDILQTYLNDATSPEFTQMIREAHDCLDLFGVEHYQGEFVQLLMLDDAVDQGETTQNIYDCTLNWQIQVLKMLGVTPSDEVRVDHLTRLLTGLHGVETFEDPQTILERANLELQPEELLAEILAAANHTPPEEWLVDIHEVSQRTIAKIIELASEKQAHKLAQTQGGDAHRAQYISAYKTFKAFIESFPKVTLLMDAQFAAGMDVGYPFVLYLNLFGQLIGTLEPIDIAANLASMALISTDGHARVREAINAHLEHYVNDLDVITKVDIAVSELMVKYETFKSTGVKQS